MRYNDTINRVSAQKAARAGARNACTNLTQPTGIGGVLDWRGFYHTPAPIASGGSHQGHSDSGSRSRGGVPQQGANMETQTAIPRTNVVSALANLRQEWQDAADRSLMSVHGNVALLLADVTMSIGLDTIEQMQVMGADLTQELDKVLAPGRNGNH